MGAFISHPSTMVPTYGAGRVPRDTELRQDLHDLENSQVSEAIMTPYVRFKSLLRALCGLKRLEGAGERIS